MGLWEDWVDATNAIDRKAIELGIGGDGLWQPADKAATTKWYQPKKITKNGKTYLTSNKTTNDLSPMELQKYIGENLIPSDNPEDRHFYMLRNPRTGDVKQGTAKGSVYERYRKDPQFQNWIVDYDQPIKNANEIERIIHGNKYALKSRKFDLGDANKRGPLQSGNTEIYRQAKNPIYSGDAVIDGVVKSAVDKLRPEQRQTFDAVMDYVSKIDLKQKDYTKKETVSRDGSISSLTTGKPEEYTGAFRKDVLKRIPETYEDVVRGSELGVEKGLGGVTGLLGADTIKKAIQKKATQNVSMMHDKDGLGALVGEVLPEFFLPATTPIKAGIGLAKGIGIGASSGLAINAGYELLKEQSGIKEGQDQNAVLAGGIGAIFGAIFGGVKGREIAKMFEEGSDETKNQIIESLPEEHRQYLVDYVKANQAHEKSLAAVEAGSKDSEEEAVVAEHVVTKKKETDEEDTKLKNTKDYDYSKMSDDDINELDRMHEEELRMQAEYEKELEAEQKQTATDKLRSTPTEKKTATLENRDIENTKMIVLSSIKTNSKSGEIFYGTKNGLEKLTEKKIKSIMEEIVEFKDEQKILDKLVRKIENDEMPEITNLLATNELEQLKDTFKKLSAKEKRDFVVSLAELLLDTKKGKKKSRQDKITEESIDFLEAERDYELQKAYKEDKVVDVKPMKHVSETTKSGKEVLNTEGLKKLSETEYEVTSPTKADDEGEVFSTKQVDYVTEDRQARAYEHEATLASNQGDISQKTSLKLAELKKIETEDDLKSFIDDRLKAFDIKWTLKKQYGQAQARLKATEKELSSAQIKANRIAYERDLYKKIAFNKKMPRDVRKLAHEKEKELKNKKAKEYVQSQKERDAKEKKRTKEIISELKEDHWARKERQLELSQRYKAQKETQGKKKTLSDEQIVSNLVKSLRDRIQEVAKLAERIEKFKGIASKPNPADEQVIKDFMELRSDLESYKKGEIDVDELRYRESLRLDERISRDRKSTFDSDYDVVMNAEDIKSKYAELGMNKRPQTLITEEKAKKALARVKRATIRGEKPHKLDVSLVRQNARKKTEIQLFLDGKISKEILKTRLDKIAKDDMPHRKFDKFEDEPYDRTKDSSRNTMEEIAEKYVKTGYVGRNKKTGKMMLREDQMHLLDNGIPPELLGRMNSKDELVKEQAKQEAVKMLNKKFREQQGITDNFDLDKHYIFKDEMSDASASAYQMIATMLGDLELAKGVKVAGTGNKDFREVIAKELEKQIPEDTLVRIREASKDYENPNGDFGKPQMKDIATTAMYGAMDESIIRDFAKKYGVTVEESEGIVNGYNKIFYDKYPSAFKLREEIYKLVPNNKGKFEWTGLYGKKSSYEAYAEIRGSLGKGKDAAIVDKTQSNMYSRALLPNIIHSIDGDAIIETARRLDLPVGTVHDAVRGKAGSQPEILKAYTDVLAEINNSNILDDIMRELGYTGPNLKEKYGGKLTEADIRSGVNKFAVEHYEGEKIPVEKKEIDDTRFKTEHEVMDDYLASMEESKHSYNVMLDFFIDTQIYKDLYRKTSKDPLKNAMFHALNGPRFTKKMAIKAPDGVDEHKFFLAQKRAHERLRRKVEFNKILSDRVLIRNGKKVPQVRGTRKYFDERGKPICAK